MALAHIWVPCDRFRVGMFLIERHTDAGILYMPFIAACVRASIGHLNYLAGGTIRRRGLQYTVWKANIPNKELQIEVRASRFNKLSWMVSRSHWTRQLPI